MTIIKRRYGKGEFARRGDAVYDSPIRARMTAEEEGKFAAIDIESGADEIDTGEFEVCRRLRERFPTPQLASEP